MTPVSLPGHSLVEKDEDPRVLGGTLSWSHLFPYKMDLFASGLSQYFLHRLTRINVLVRGNLIIQPVITSKTTLVRSVAPPLPGRCSCCPLFGSSKRLIAPRGIISFYKHCVK